MASSDCSARRYGYVSGIGGVSALSCCSILPEISLMLPLHSLPSMPTIRPVRETSRLMKGSAQCQDYHAYNLCLIAELAPNPARSCPIIEFTVCTPALAAADMYPSPTSK